MAREQWKKQWNSWIALKPTMPGVWRRKEGGFLVRGRATDPHTKQQHDVKITLTNTDARNAYLALQEALKRIRTGEAFPPPPPPPPSPEPAAPPSAAAPSTATPEGSDLPLWGDYARALLKRKVTEGKIRSAKTRQIWNSILKKHLVPAFGTMRVDEMNRRRYFAWRHEVAQKIQADEYSPSTANTWLAVLAVVTNAAFDEFEIDRKSPTLKVEKFDAREHPTYTEEEPNALTVEEVGPFLKKLREICPQHFAMAVVGFATGLRPSSLRPLRRGGSSPDVRIDEGILYVRRSQTVGDEVMETTKTGIRQRITLPADVVAVLQWHVDTLPEGPMTESDLLFPSEKGGYRAPSVLDKPFQRVAKALGLRKHLSARAMRRTFQDLARATGVPDIVTRAVSGHATDEMQRHYSTLHPDEVRAGLTRVGSLAGIREALDAGASNDQGGVHVVCTLPETKKAG